MKNPITVIALLASTLAGVQAQVTGTTTQTTAAQPALPAPTAFSPVSRDGSSTVWERTVYEQGPNGTVVPKKHRYTELASGLNYLDPGSGQWQPSRAEISLLPPGGAFAAAATQGSHKASFPLDLAQGVILLSGPDGKQLTSRPVGLFFEDDSNSVLIAILTNSVGELVGSNQVLYPNAFEGAAASIRYTYTKAGFEQDIVVQGQLPDPGTLGLNPARARLGVLTAFFDTNNPVATSGPTDPQTGLSDTTLRFGAMTMTKGRAFSVGDGEQTPPPASVTPANLVNWITNAAQRTSASGATPSYKRWFQLNGRNFLMEEVPYRRVAAQLQQLPPATGRLNTVSTNLFATDLFLDAIPARLLSLPASGEPVKPQTMRLTRVDWDQTRAVVLDYQVVSAGGDYTFQGDTTYFVSGSCYFNNVILEGGTVIKYPNVNSVPGTQIGAWTASSYIEVDEALTCQTSSYHPAVFTAADDNTAGEPLPYPLSSGGLPSGFYANPAIFFDSPYYSVSLSNVRVNYAELAFLVGDNISLTVSDSQVYATGIMALLGMNDGYSYYTMTLTDNNCLYSGPSGGGFVVLDYGNGGDSYNLNNCTMANVYCMSFASNPVDAYGNAVNSIFANVGYAGNISWQGNENGFYQCWFDDNTGPTFGSNPITTYTYPFQTVGGGNYYLADGTFRGQGTTTGISPSLLADLATTTTQPPDNSSYVNQYIYSDNTLSPRGLANTGAPDLGYHYPVLDYIVSNTSLNANLTIDAGTAIGWQGQGLSFSGFEDEVNFNGTVNHPCYFVRCNTVQEADNNGGSSNDGTGIAGSGNYPNVNATFTRFSALGDMAAFLDGNDVFPASIYNCEFWSGMLGGSAVNTFGLSCYNCLFDRSFINYSLTANSDNDDLYLQNCTLHGGTLTLSNPNNNGQTVSSIVRDCAFDGTTLVINDSYDVIHHNFFFSYNAYLSGANYLPGSNPSGNPNHDVFVTGVFNWQSGPRGNYYLPNGSPLVNANNQANDPLANSISVWTSLTPSSTTLAAFTTDPVYQTPDAGPVDIGYHYFISPTVVISGNQSDGPIQSFDYASGVLLNSFTPDGANGLPFYPQPAGRAFAIYGGKIYYTEFQDSDLSSPIHVCLYGDYGTGGHDLPNSSQQTSPLPNPRQGYCIQGLAFHNGELYALTGYNTGQPEVYELNPNSGAVIAGPISIHLPPTDPDPDSADGFTVLMNGDFLINDFDGGDGCTTYREYNATTGQPVPGGLVVNVANFSTAVGFSVNAGTGVTCAPDGTLYFVVGNVVPNVRFNIQAIVHTDSNGGYISSQVVNSIDIEEIGVMNLQ